MVPLFLGIRTILQKLFQEFVSAVLRGIVLGQDSVLAEGLTEIVVAFKVRSLKVFLKQRIDLRKRRLFGRGQGILLVALHVRQQ